MKNLEKNNIAIIGAGISGLTAATLLKDNNNITIFEKDTRPGGLIKCDMVQGSLFHTCGGHVFNTKRKDVLEFFWNIFNRENEFVLSNRNSTIIFNEQLNIPYPIENYSYEFDDNTLSKIIRDLFNLKQNSKDSSNFEEFLKNTFGETLYSIYFRPYNKKIWRRDLSNVPLKWLEGKLPMPSPDEIIFNNIRRINEKKFVHSTFWYEKKNGSQYLADKLSSGLNLLTGVVIDDVKYLNNKWIINNIEFDKVIFCGNIRALPKILKHNFPSEYINPVESLQFHGTTSVFCEIEKNPYSWIYLPNESYDAHRIICTGNFSENNNSPGKMTGTIEFTDEISKEEILEQLKRIPLSPKYLTHKFNACTYPIQDKNTRHMIGEIKDILSKKDFYITGRFGDWEYYNMDAAMGASIDMINKYNLKT